MRCTCGYTEFAERVRLRITPGAARWRPAGYAAAHGLGATALGTLLGAGGVTAWGRIDLNVTTGMVELICLACSRARESKAIGAGVPLGSWNDDNDVYVLMSDVFNPVCMTARFIGEQQSVSSTISVVEVPVPAMGSTVITTTVLPQGAIVGDTVYKVPIPQDLQGMFRLVFFDTCLGLTWPVTLLGLGGLISVHGRSGDVIAQVGDYKTSQIGLIEGGTVQEALDSLAAEIQGLARPTGDLGLASPGVLAVCGIQGRPYVFRLGAGGYETWLRWNDALGSWVGGTEP